MLVDYDTSNLGNHSWQNPWHIISLTPIWEIIFGMILGMILGIILGK
jgi:hypothetical protein